MVGPVGADLTYVAYLLAFQIVLLDSRKCLQLEGITAALWGTTMGTDSDPAFFLLRQSPEHISEVLSQSTIKYLAAVLRNEYHMIFTLPNRVGYAFVPVHLRNSFPCAFSGLRKESLQGTPVNVKLLLPSRQSRGVSWFS